MNILLTGASRGLGKALAKKLLQKGHQVTLSTYSNEKIEQLKKIFHTYIYKVEVIDFSISDSETFLKQLETFPLYDLIIDCACVYSSGGLHTSHIEEISKIGAFIKNSMLFYKKICDAHSKAKHPLHIITIGSIVGISGNIKVQTTPYSILKGSQLLLSEGINKEYKGHNISASHLVLGSFRERDLAIKFPEKYISLESVIQKILEISISKEMLSSLLPTTEKKV